ncbi:MAG TPA: vanadium-dependent haloperoxidase [Chitinophagaceae bacterium]|nr:vanadium-dependent haloperoxidase [Chitinophagaceae bacterium]
MRQVIAIVHAVFFVCFGFEAAAGDWKEKTENAEFIHRSIKTVTDVIVYDIYSPPVASRTYAYISIAAYEALIHHDPAYVTLAGQLHGLTAFPQPASATQYSYTLAAVQAIFTVAKTLVISEEKLATFQAGIQEEFKACGVPADVFAASLAYGQQVAGHVLAWSAKDNYKQSRSLPRFAVSDDPATWKPTPPAYIKAVEPHWNKMRTFIIDSAAQFRPAPPPDFSTDKASRFYKEALAVHNAGAKLTKEQNEIANFWDCNPYRMNVRGHVMYATKKISPNGHWVNITRLACKKVNAGVVKSAEAYACLSVALADCFISCWDEKYRSNVVRPETYINQYIDTAWVPELQTPPFPEYTSGHSVVSAAAAIVLTKLFGENFSYTDSTELEFGLPVRRFTSFKQAAEEAAISRFYGGIHYMPAITNGTIEGREIGLFVTRKLKTKKGR